MILRASDNYTNTKCLTNLLELAASKGSRRVLLCLDAQGRKAVNIFLDFY